MNKVVNIELINNDSMVYCNNSIWNQHKYGNVKIIGMVKKQIGKHFFLVEFDDGTQVVADNGNIKNGVIKNPYFPNVHGIGCVGRVKSASKHILYRIWSQMINRCYNPDSEKYKDYGCRNIKVSSTLLCFEDYMIYISNLQNYNLLKESDSFTYDIDRINNDKGYFENNLRIVTRSNNCLNRRDNVYLEICFNNGKKECGNMSVICKKYDLDVANVRKCIRGKRKSHKNCTFKIIEGGDILCQKENQKKH